MSTVELTVAGVLFDSDGVLVDSHRQVADAWYVLCDEFGLDWPTLETASIGVPARQTLERYLAGDTLERAVARLEDLEVDTAVGTDPIPGALELLAGLPDGRWTIVTSATRRLGEARWRGAGLPVPPRCVTFDDVLRGKPFPDPFLAGAELLGFAPARCLVFEDSPAGGDGATAAGASVVAVGGQPWRVEPFARIADLRCVEVVGAGTTGITIALTDG